jgi:hypothetical protein
LNPAAFIHVQYTCAFANRTCGDPAANWRRIDIALVAAVESALVEPESLAEQPVLNIAANTIKIVARFGLLISVIHAPLVLERAWRLGSQMA